MAVANRHNGTSYNTNSKIYRWNGTSFVEFQSIPTNGAIGWEFFTVGIEVYLAVANYYNGTSYNINSKIYRWGGASFVEFQSIQTSGAVGWEYFTIGTEAYLAVANYYNGISHNINSRVYRWNGTNFIEIQSIPTSGAHDWEFFTIGAEAYMAVANYYGTSYNTNSKIYQWAGTSLVANARSTEIYPGDPVEVRLTIQNAYDLYGAQATCTVSSTVLTLQNAVFGPFFTNPLIGANLVDGAAGTWLGALSLQNPTPPLSGNGLFATISYRAGAPGATAVTCEPLFSDRDGGALPVTYVGTSVTVLPFATASGVATYQGRLAHASIILTAAGPVTRTATTDASGAYTVSGLRAGSYAMTADVPRYLPNCTIFAVTSGQGATLVATRLKGGDKNDDGAINAGDAALVGFNFGKSVPPADGRADINADGKVNIYDLSILGGNFGLSGCQSW